MKITSGIIGGAQRVVLYGPEGIGKTSFAACMPDPVFLDTEGGTVRYNVRRLPAPESWPMLLSEVEWCIQNPEALLQLMQQDGVRADEIQYAVAAKGYFPNDMPISAYPADFVQGVLIGAWPQVRGMVAKNRSECPF